MHFPLDRTTTSELSCLILVEGGVYFGGRVIAADSERAERWILYDACPFIGLVRCFFQECFWLHCLGRGVGDASAIWGGLCEWRLQSVVLK